MARRLSKVRNIDYYHKIIDYSPDSAQLTCVTRETDEEKNGYKGHLYECDIGNPLPANEAVAFDVDFSAGGIEVTKEAKFKVNVTRLAANYCN